MYQTIWKVSVESGKFPGVWKVSGQSWKFPESLKFSKESGKFPESLESLQRILKIPDSLESCRQFGKFPARGGICQCRHCRRQCKIFASGVNFSIFTHFLCFFLLKLLKLGEIGGVKFLAWKSRGVKILDKFHVCIWPTQKVKQLYYRGCLSCCSPTSCQATWLQRWLQRQASAACSPREGSPRRTRWGHFEHYRHHHYFVTDKFPPWLLGTLSWQECVKPW